MPPPDDHDPLRTTDQEPGATTPARDGTADAALPSSVVEGSTGPYVPGAAAAPRDTERERGPASVSVPGYDILGVLVTCSRKSGPGAMRVSDAPLRAGDDP